MRPTNKLSKNGKLTFVSLFSISALVLNIASCDSCESKNDDPTTLETPQKDKAENTKSVDLKLTRLSGPILKMGGDKTCYLKISNQGTERIEPNQLQLLITREKGNVATIEGAQEIKKGIYSLAIPEAIDKDGAVIQKQIKINLGSDLEAVFKFQLQYKGEIQKGVEERVTCQAGKLELLVHQERILRDQVARFELVNYSENEMDLIDLNVEVVSLNNATFQLVNIEKGDQKLGTSTDQVKNVFDIKGQTIVHGAGIAGFTILNANGETKSEVVVKLKRGQQEIFISEKVIWQEKGVLLELKADEQFTDKSPVTLEIYNQGNVDINTDDIEISLNNDRGVDFKLGNESGSKIQGNLSKVLGKTVLLKNDNTSLKLTLQSIVGLEATKHYGAELRLVMREKNNNLLIDKTLRWFNNQKVMKHVMNPELQEVSNKFNANRHNDPNNSGNKPSQGKSRHFSWSSEELKLDVNLIPKFGQRTIQAFQLRPEAEKIIPQSRAFKKQFQDFLKQEAAFIPDFLKNDIENYVLSQPDDELLQAIDQSIQKDFEIVVQSAKTALQDVQSFSTQKNAQGFKKAIERIDGWVVVADQFVTDINTQAAKDLASQVKGYQADAKKLPNP